MLSIHAPSCWRGVHPSDYARAPISLARGGKKDEFEAADAIRNRERTVAERSNARLKDEFGARNIMVKGTLKVMSHLMFGVFALSANQLVRLRRR